MGGGGGGGWGRPNHVTKKSMMGTDFAPSPKRKKGRKMGGLWRHTGSGICVGMTPNLNRAASGEVHERWHKRHIGTEGKVPGIFR